MTIKQQQILDAFNERHACKEFDSTKKIPSEDFNFILEAGRLSPSSFGFEPWKFLVITSDEAKAKLAKAEMWGATKQLPTSSHFVVILSATAKLLKYDSEYITYILKNVKKFDNEGIKGYVNVLKNFQEEDFDLLKDSRYLADWGKKQTYIALANMMSVAALVGIDSCPIEGFNPKRVAPILNQHFNVNTEDYDPSVLVAFGYRKNSVPTKARRDLSHIVSFY